MLTRTVLVVEDHDRVRRALAAELRRADFKTLEAADGEQGWEEFCSGQPDLVITDLVMPTCDGQSFLERIVAESSVPVIMYSSRGTIRAAVDALKAGAVDFLPSEDATIDDIVSRARAAIESHRNQSGHQQLEEQLVGSSSQVRRLRQGITSVLHLPDPVLVIGEPGSGRGEIVEILHSLSGETSAKLREIPCTREPGSLPIEGEGPVFLRDIDRLEEGAQGAWARHLVRYRQSASNNTSRVFASTSLSLHSLESAGFHQGLFRLLSPCALLVPSLRARTEDLGVIAETLVERFARRVEREVTLTSEARQLIQLREWPGNLAQLSRVLQRAVTFSHGRTIQAGNLKEILAEEELNASQFRDERNNREREALIRTMRETGGNVKRTAEILGKSRAAIYRLLEKHRASSVDFR